MLGRVNRGGMVRNEVFDFLFSSCLLEELVQMHCVGSCTLGIRGSARFNHAHFNFAGPENVGCKGRLYKDCSLL